MTFAGVVLLVFGLPSVAVPYELARFGERLDAIDSTRRMNEAEQGGTSD